MYIFYSALDKLTSTSVSTCYGQPSTTLYNSTLQFRIDDADDMKVVPPDLFIRLRQEMAANRITVALYGNKDSVDADYLSDADTSKRGAFYANLEAQRFKEEQKFLENRYTGKPPCEDSPRRSVADFIYCNRHGVVVFQGHNAAPSPLCFLRHDNPRLS